MAAEIDAVRLVDPVILVTPSMCEHRGMPRVLLGVTGSIAAYKAVELARLLIKRGVHVQVAMTRSATEFVTPLTFRSITGRPVLTDLFDASTEIEHVERAHEVDLIVIAPASANTLAKVALGLADDPLTATVLASTAPLVVAPAMETGMWENVATKDNLRKLAGRGVEIVGPAEGPLASGRSGAGRMVEPSVVSDAVMARLSRGGDLAGVRILLTAGPTWEAIDPVRILTNRSTGSMGIGIARAAAARGATVSLILGPTHLAPPEEAEVIRVESAEQMLAAGEDRIGSTDVLIATAAVSDYRPSEARPSKLKRTDPAAATLELAENPDVLATLAKKANKKTTIVGFAAETEDVEVGARGKLRRKGCDLVIANLVGPDKGFGEGETEVIAVTASGATSFGPASKAAVAQFVLDQVVRLREQG